MSFTPKSVAKVAVAYGNLTQATIELFTWAAPEASESADARERTRIRQTLWRFERAYERVVTEDPKPFAVAVDQLTDIMHNLRPSVMVWVETLELLAQDVERRFSPKSGQGPLKARVVKSALTHLLLESKVRFKGLLPEGDLLDIARPLVMERIADWTLDFVVHLLNANQAWTVAVGAVPESDGPSLAWRFRAWCGQFMRVVLRPFRPFLLRLASQMVSDTSPLTPDVAALMGVVRQRGGDPDTLLARIQAFLTWMGENRERIRGIIQVMSLAIKEAELIAKKTATERQDYVRNLVMVFLEDEGIVDPDSIFYEPIEALVDTGIEAVARILERRNVIGRGLVVPSREIVS